MLAGCQYLERRLESAAYFSVTSAGFAGRFRIAFGRWPASVNELEEFICVPGHADRFAIHQMSCDDVVAWPYRTELIPDGNHLRMNYYDRSTGKLLCKLRLQAPPDGADLDIFPMVVIRSTVISCSGARWNTGSASLPPADVS